MKEKYLCEVALRSPVHITLVAPFWMKNELENEVIGTINVFSANQKNITITLNNFSHFKSRVIYIDVVPNEPLNRLKNELTTFLLETGLYSLKEDVRPFHPHVTIATRDLYKKAFDETWEILKDKKFNAGWTAKSVSLLKYNNKAWQVIANAQFGVAE